MRDMCIELLDIKPGGAYLDATFGRGGHAGEIRRRLNGGALLCVDKDGEAETAAREGGFDFKRGDFRDIGNIARERFPEGADGILFDLGVSSPQLDEPERGFSFRLDAPLDMRMNRDAVLTAREIVGDWAFEDITRCLREYGEERYAAQIARKIVQARETSPIETTGQLAEIIKSAVPAKARRAERHPAVRTFQALRIAVNDELGALRDGLDGALKILRPGGRLAVISFHSLEDRIVKEFIRGKTNGCKCPPDFPQCACGFKPELKDVTRGALTPCEAEIEGNPRSRGAKLRAAEKL